MGCQNLIQPIANPDNPTGTYVSEQEVKAFMKRIPDRVVVFFDEAYFEYATERDFPKTLQYLKSRKVIIARTFSKAYGLAGLRVGYGMSNPAIIDILNRVREPFNVNSLAQIGAQAALDDQAHVERSRKFTKKQKEYLYRELDKLGISHKKSATNFILIDLKTDATVVYEKLLKKGVIVRDMDAWGLETCIRVTIGRERENKRFVRELERALRE
mgnify:CR=1 FL=1